MIAALLIAIGYAYGLWVLFIAVMALRWAWGRLTLPVKVMACPLVLAMIAADVSFNLVATLLFFDWPHEPTFSQRMSRYKGGAGWRAAVARWICANVLDPFEIGGHCRA